MTILANCNNNNYAAAGSDQVVLLILQVNHTGDSCFFALKRSFGPQNGHYKDLGNPFGVVHLL